MSEAEITVTLGVSNEIRKALEALPAADVEAALAESIAKLADPAPTVDAKQVAFRRTVLAKADAEERYALMVVLEPETKDSQDDIYSHDEVRKACFRFMEAYRSGDKEGHMGVMHKRLADDELAILENYLTKNDEKIGEQLVKAGTWLMGLRVKADKLWDQVQKGEMTGLSIGGSAIRTPVAGN